MYDDLFDDEEEIERNITCQRCGEDDLHWQIEDGIPKLYDEDGDRHRCEPSTKGLKAL